MTPGAARIDGVLGSVGQTVTPVIRVTAVVFEREDTKMVGKNPVVDRVRKAGHEVMPDIGLNDTPPFGNLLNNSNCAVCGVEKLSAECRNTSLVELCRLDEFRFGIGVVNQAHPIARRAACMTSS